MNHKDSNSVTHEQWRELGFYYGCDDDAAAWTILGDKTGLYKFATLLRDYASEPKNQPKSEHSHYGPYMYLKIMTWPTAGIAKDTIHGPLEDLKRLADIVDDKLKGIGVGDSIDLAEDYVDSPEYRLILTVCADQTDPASLDPLLAPNGV